MKSSEYDVNAELPQLAEEARRRGYTNPERVAERLRQIIGRNARYLDYRSRKGREGAYNELVAEDSLVLAQAVELLSRIEEQSNVNPFVN